MNEHLHSHHRITVKHSWNRVKGTRRRDGVNEHLPSNNWVLRSILGRKRIQGLGVSGNAKSTQAFNHARIEHPNQLKVDPKPDSKPNLEEGRS
jgi:hypothetical protein